MNGNRDQMHPEDLRNLIIFALTALFLWMAYDHFFLKPFIEETRKAQAEAQQNAAPSDSTHAFPGQSAGAGAATPQERSETLQNTPRIEISNPVLFGSINLKGGRLDDIALRDYFKTLDKQESVELFSPSRTAHPKYAEFGWLAADKKIAVPDRNTLWQVRGADTGKGANGGGANGGSVSGAQLSPDTPVELYWDNGQGLVFELRYELDEKFMFSLTQKVINRSQQTVQLFPYGLISQHGLAADHAPVFIVHEGAIAYTDGNLTEKSYKDMRKEARKNVRREFQGQSGWVGLTDKYWMTALIPESGAVQKHRFSFTPFSDTAKDGRYQVDLTGPAHTIAAGKDSAVSTRIFTGAKELGVLENYSRDQNVPRFDLAVDFGIFYFLTRPFHFVIHSFYTLSGNFGLAIILFIIVLRLMIFPLANISFRSFARMRQVSPKIVELREQCGDDRTKLQQEIVALYKKEKVNPMAGCLPILIQIPIFFALYKVLSVTIEMRHAPFFGWIKDLSAPDPTSVFNLFGALPYQVPEFLMIGAWPCLMLVSMLAQRLLSPPPQDPMQAKMIALMPYIFVFILAKFAAGLIVYFTFSNILSVLQQYVIMRRMGVEISLFGKSKTEKKLEDAVEHGPAVHPVMEMLEEEVEDALFDHDEKGEASKDGALKSAAQKISKPKPKKKKKKKK